jgi:hypothetical protein
MSTPTGTQGIYQRVKNEELKKHLWEPHTVWTFIVLEAGSNVSDSELVAGFDRVLNALITKYGRQ